MGMQIDEAGGDDQPVGVDHLVRHPVGPPADLGDLAVFDPHVTPEAWDPRAIDNRPTLDVDVVLGHIHPRFGRGVPDPTRHRYQVVVRGYHARPPAAVSSQWAAAAP